MGLKKCSVPGCKNTKSVRRRLPIHDKEVLSIWLDRIGNPELFGMDLQKLRAKKFICDTHFSPHCKLERSYRLQYQSLPTINLPGFNGEPNMRNSLLPYYSGRVPLPETVINIEQQVSGTTEDQDPSSYVAESCVDYTKMLETVSIATEETMCDTNIILEMQYNTGHVALSQAETALGESNSEIPSTSTLQMVEPAISASTAFPLVSTAQQPIASSTRRLPTKRKSLLAATNVRTIKELTPQSRTLYNIARTLLKREDYYRRRCHHLKDKMQYLEEYFNTKEFKIIQKMNVSASNFIKSQLRNFEKTPSGRRFLHEEKMFALNILKTSPRCYRLLRRVFALPSKQILLSMVKKIPFKAGLNEKILQLLQDTIKRMAEEDRHCVLLFDEMQLSAAIDYNTHEDCFIGLSDFGNEKRLQIADHALVFMVRGIRKKWKQPLAYYFVHRTIQSVQLAVIIKDIVRKCRCIGLRVVASICDQGATNRGAIRMLLKETQELCSKEQRENRYIGYLVDNEEVVHLYDPPHLLKCFRNTFLDNDIHFTFKNQQKVAKWSDIITFYRNDQGDDDIRIAPKLTVKHIFKDKINKMKVSVAAQVFSQRLSAVMRKFAGCDIPGVMVLDKSAADTADLLLFIDKLFDSVNGVAVPSADGKNLRVAITDHTQHISVWNEAIAVFSTMQFYNSSTNILTNPPPTIKNWIFTLRGLKHIWQKLKTNNHFKFLALRNFNQDSLENLFGCIRAHGFRNINPTCKQFVYLLKSAILNNFMAPQSQFMNCEEDQSDCLNSFKIFLGAGNEESTSNSAPTFQSVELGPLQENPVTVASKTYVAGFIAKKILSKIRNCNVCKTELTTATEGEIHSIIKVRNYSHHALCLPSTYFSFLFRQLLHIIITSLPQIANQVNISKILKQIISVHITSIFSCKSHKLFDDIINYTIVFISNVWCKNINKILKGSCCESEVTDNIKKVAHDYYVTHKKRRK